MTIHNEERINALLDALRNELLDALKTGNQIELISKAEYSDQGVKSHDTITFKISK